MTDFKQYCTLKVGDLLLGIEVGEIQEIRRDTSIMPVPLSPTDIRGLINLRGQIVTAIDLRRRIGRRRAWNFLFATWPFPLPLGQVGQCPCGEYGQPQ